MAQSNLFVSHSHEDDAFADQLVADLREAGVDVWLDRTDLGSGNFQQRINDALMRCDWFVLVLTRSAIASTWVQHEVDAANLLMHEGRIHNLIFIQAKPVELYELPPLWRVYNVFDATTEAKYASARERLVRAVRGTARETATMEQMPKPQVKPQVKAPVVPVTTRQTLFGDVAGMTCPYCGVFNPLNEVEQLVDRVTLPSTLWGGLPARCGKCSHSFYYTPPANQ